MLAVDLRQGTAHTWPTPWSTQGCREGQRSSGSVWALGEAIWVQGLAHLSLAA